MAEIAAEGTNCSSCGRVNRAGRKFCADCGTALTVVCRACAAANEPDERYCGDCGSPLEGAVPSAAHARDAAVERRFVSVLFVDLVGFTSLAEGRDPEEVRELLSRYFEIARQVVERYGGVVEKFIGDAVMAVWGAPIAQEDDAERAVRAALDLVAAVAALGSELDAPGLAARAGVLSGEAAVTLGAAGQGMVAGDLVNSAARVQAIAEPGSVLVGETTRRASDGAIAYSGAGTHELKGREGAVQLWRALRVTAGRAGSMKAEGIEPPFVGRERELRLVKEHLHASADERRAHLVSVVGIAGIGKSRLALELYKYVDGIEQTVQWHRGRCLAYGDGVAYSALAEMVRMRAGIAEGEEPELARAKLGEMLSLHVEDSEERTWIEPRLAQLLALTEPKTGELPDMFAGWRLFFERIADRDPVVLVFEDVQWADAALLEFVGHLLEWSRNHPIFVLALARPEVEDRHPNWSPGRNSTSLSLEPLSRGAMEELLDGFVPGLPGDLRGRILDSAEGVPLYAVETVRMLLDRGLLERRGEDVRPTGPIVSLEIPETLHGLIAARLDGLADAERKLLQHASVLGKTFTKAALAVVTRHDETELDPLLEALVRKEILSLQADPRSPERGQYGFLQDLLRQVAYETLPRKERKARHLAAASYLEQMWLGGDEDVVEIVASHLSSALDLDPDASDAGDIRARALDTLTQAGERAASLAATESAQRYFEQALELTTDDPVPEAELHERAGRMAMFRGRAADARTHLEQAIGLYESSGRLLAATRVTARLGILAWTEEGDIERAVADLSRAFDVLVGEERSAELAMLAAQLARVLFFSGRTDETMERNELALEIAEALGVTEVLCHGLITRSLMLDGAGRLEEARVILRFALDLALASDLSEVALRGYNNLAGAAESQSRLREALDVLRAMSVLARKVGDRPSVLQSEASIVRVLVEVGEYDAALELGEELSREFADGSPATRADLEMQSFFVVLDRGELGEARRRWEAVSEFVDASDVQIRAAHHYAEAWLLLAEGRSKEAEAAAATVLESSLGVGNWTMSAGLDVGLEVASALGDTAKVDELLSRIERLPPGHVSPLLRALGARHGALRSAREGDAQMADAGFRRAADVFREIGMPSGLGEALLEHAEWLVSQGRVDEAAELAAEAREIFERLRATPWLERLDRLTTEMPVAMISQ